MSDWKDRMRERQKINRSSRKPMKVLIYDHGEVPLLTALEEELVKGLERLAQEFENNKDVPQWVYDLINKARGT